jgi:DNA-binding CsgD family transcriptional regulator
VFLKAYADKTSDAQNASYPDFDLDRRVGEIADEYDITDREADIMRLIFYGMSNNEIADQLFISTSTVKSHIHSILQKTGAKSRSEIMFLIYNPMIIERSYGEDR